MDRHRAGTGEPRVAEGDRRPGWARTGAIAGGRHAPSVRGSRRAVGCRVGSAHRGLCAPDRQAPVPLWTLAQFRALIFPARSKSAPVRPPAECVDSVNVTLFHWIRMSGWWLACSATYATAPTKSIAYRKSLCVTVATMLSPWRAQPGTPASRPLISSSVSSPMSHDSGPPPDGVPVGPPTSGDSLIGRHGTKRPAKSAVRPAIGRLAPAGAPRLAFDRAGRPNGRCREVPPGHGAQMTDPHALLRRTPLTSVHERLGATLTGFAGWLMPLRYGSETAEHNAVRTAAGLFDLSHMGEIMVTGPGAPAALDYALVGQPSTP